MGCAGSKAVDHSEAGKQPVFVREGDDAPQLPPDKLKLVKDMFKEWDIEGNGMIEIKALKGVTVNVGPQESQVLSQLIAMDYNGDGFVEASVRAGQPRSRSSNGRALVRCPSRARVIGSSLLLARLSLLSPAPSLSPLFMRLTLRALLSRFVGVGGVLSVDGERAERRGVPGDHG